MEILIQTPMATVGANSLWFEKNISLRVLCAGVWGWFKNRVVLYRVIALIKFMINLIRIYKETMVRSKDYHVKLYRDLH